MLLRIDFFGIYCYGIYCISTELLFLSIDCTVVSNT
jgi:hypothetical protein